LRLKSELEETTEHECVIQQFLANENPDVDAVFRLTNEGPENFEGLDVVLGPGTWCPFNSQNTLWRPTAFPYLYLPFTASFRMTDIWRSFVAQTCVHAMDGNVAFRGASMYQQRNEHSLIGDFADEISGYLNNDLIMVMLSELVFEQGGGAGANLRQCYKAMVTAGHLRPEEIGLVDGWLEDYRRAVERAKTPVSAIAASAQPIVAV
jgi:STELLO glycosyltransferases